jgi:hypothetical protein
VLGDEGLLEQIVLSAFRMRKRNWKESRKLTFRI